MNDNLIYYMNIQYMYCQIYILQIIIIQKNYRCYKERKNYHFIKYNNKYKDVLKDIIEMSYIPPNKDIILLNKGGFRYREGLKSFNASYYKLMNNISKSDNI